MQWYAMVCILYIYICGYVYIKYIHIYVCSMCMCACCFQNANAQIDGHVNEENDDKALNFGVPA